jgi:type I restriction enzyme M protein
MFVQSEEFVEAHGGGKYDLAIYGQESNPTTWKLCQMNLAIRGIEGDLGPSNADSFFNDLHKDLKADYILANPPFNMKAWGGDQLQQDVRWAYGAPPKNNANFAWIQHILHHLSPNGRAGFVLANGSMSSQTSGEGEIRKALVEADLVDCMVSLPGQLFYTTQIPVCLWFLTRNKGNGWGRDRRGEVLFIDAREMGTMISRTQRELTENDIEKISGTYHSWAGQHDSRSYKDVAGFCKNTILEEISKHNHVLTPGRYVGVANHDQDDVDFSRKFHDLQIELNNQFDISRQLENKIRTSLQGMIE